MLTPHELQRLENTEAAAIRALERLGHPDEDRVTGDELALWPVVRDLRTRLYRVEALAMALNELETGGLEPAADELEDVSDVSLANRGWLSVGGAAGDENYSYLDVAALARPMSRDEALVVAAWLVCLADPGGRRFEAIRTAVGNT